MNDKAPAIEAELTLTGQIVRLEPLEPQHHDGLVEATLDGQMWTRWYTSAPKPEAVRDMIAERLKRRDEGSMVPLVAIRQSDDVVLGCTSFYDIRPEVPRVSVGYTWNRQSTHGSGTNAESKLLLMEYAFERAGVAAVRYETSWANQQSRAAIERLGCRQDGVLRADRLEPTGVLRDTVVFSLLQHEWPSAKANLQMRVNRHLGESH